MVVSGFIIYRIKYNSDGIIERYKARLVVKDYTQQEGIDYSKPFSPVAKSISVRVMLVLVVAKGWLLRASNGSQQCFPMWWFRRGGLYVFAP